VSGHRVPPLGAQALDLLLERLALAVLLFLLAALGELEQLGGGQFLERFRHGIRSLKGCCDSGLAGTAGEMP